MAQIGQWMYNTRDNVFYYMGYTGVLCEESSRSISLEKYQEFIVEEDRLSFTNWCRKNEEGLNEDSISYRVRVAGEIYYMRLQAYLRDELPNGSCNIEGRQDISDHMTPGCSITDPCLGWEDTERLIYDIAEKC